MASKWNADDGTLLANSVEDMISLLDMTREFSTWSGIYLNAAKCKITAYIQELQAIPKKRDRDDALRSRLAHVKLARRPIGALTQDEPLPGGYLGTSLTASLSLMAHLLWTKSRIDQIGRALGRTPLPPTLNNASYYTAPTQRFHTLSAAWLSPHKPYKRWTPCLRAYPDKSGTHP